METTEEYIMYDPDDDTVMCRGDAGWQPIATNLQTAKRWLRVENAQRHAYLDRFQILPVKVVKTVEVTIL